MAVHIGYALQQYTVYWMLFGLHTVILLQLF